MPPHVSSLYLPPLLFPLQRQKKMSGFQSITTIPAGVNYHPNQLNPLYSIFRTSFPTYSIHSDLLLQFHQNQSLSPPQTTHIQSILSVSSFLHSKTHIKSLGNSTFPRFKPATVFNPAILIAFILDHGTTTAWSTSEYCQIPQLT